MAWGRMSHWFQLRRVLERDGVSAELVPLPIWGVPQPGDMEALRAAKASLNLPYLIVPCAAVPGSPTRILALREPPPFIADYRGSIDPQNDPELAAKMLWALDDSIEDPKASLVIHQLRAIFGPEVREVTPGA